MHKPKTILCVDDEPDIRMVLALALKVSLGAEVSAVASAEEAFAYLEDNPAPDLILLDTKMPGMDGYHACAKLRADARYRDVPIIFLTARALPAERDRALSVGASACLAKPFDPVTIGDDILAALEGGG